MTSYQQILLARDFSPSSDLALQQAVHFAQHYSAELHILFADVLHADPYSFGASMEPARTTGELKGRLEEYTQKSFEELGLDTSGISITYAVERDVAPGPAILNYADEITADLIVMGTHGRRGLRRILMGSVAEEVVRLSSCPVFTIQPEATTQFPFRSILLPVDFSEHSRTALERAKEMAGRFNSRLTLLHIIEDTLPPSYHTGNIFSEREVDERTLERAKKKLTTFFSETAGPDNVQAEFLVEGGHAADRIIHYASTQDTDVIMLSSHGRTGIERFTMGSVAEKVLRNVRCPVFTIKAYPEAISNMRSQKAGDSQA